jgi:L-seryl-tRNA(Ser) seleniumtransferase
MKVGKEQIAGLVAALERFVSCDTKEERAAQDRRLAAVAQALNGVRGARLHLLTPETAPRPYPTLVVDLDEQVIGKTVESVINELLDDGAPPVAVSQNFLDRRAIGIVAIALKDEQVEPLADRLTRVLRGAGKQEDGS